MTRSLRDAFNHLPQDKIVSMQEFRRLSHPLYGQLKLGDRLYLSAVDRPLSAMAGLSIAFRLMTDRRLRAEFEAINADGSCGYYNGAQGAYVSVGSMVKMLEKAEGVLANPGFQSRLNEKIVQALDACTDCKGGVMWGSLTPIKFG